MIGQRALEAIEASDADDLLRVIDGYVAARQWNDLVELRQRCREAVTRGKQLWGVEEHIRYRLALEAPGEFAGPVVTEGPARFALGPLAEVSASTKTWAEMEPHLSQGPERMTLAAERVVRGESLDEPIADLPSALMDWEPAYQVAVYKADKLEAPSPSPPPVSEATLSGSAPERVHDIETEGALGDLVQAWTQESNGRAETVSVSGTALEAVRSLGLTRARLGELEMGQALAWMAWAGASGGAHGRRRGSAAGRYGTWWALATLLDMDWPAEPAELGRAVESLRFMWFDDGAPSTGWALRMAIEDSSSGLSWAISAVDAAD